MTTERQVVLIVDDDKNNRTLLFILLKEDYKIILAKDGHQAVEKALKHKPDLILLDVLMPEVDGFKVIEALKSNDQTGNIPVIFISALDKIGDEAHGLELGAVDYICKPFQPAIVRARVHNHIQLVRQRKMLDQMAYFDYLTEIPNRRHLNKTLEQEHNRCLRDKKALSVVMIDVDYFKQYNDNYGHSMGDRVLHQVAQVLKSGLRGVSDQVARYGGEEFSIILPAVDQAGGKDLAEQLRKDVEALQLPHEKSLVSQWITVSIGGISKIPTEEETVSCYYTLADEQLYKAKQAGRNKVFWMD